ncbi:MAG: hypothetical protein ACRCVU_02745, partial [Flavobacterium sp.]
MNKNKKILTILAVVITLLCVVGIGAHVLKKSVSTSDYPHRTIDTNNSSDEIKNKEIRDILTQMGYGNLIDSVSFHVVTSIDYDVFINGMTYSDVSLYTFLFAEYGEDSSSACVDVLFVVRDNNSKSIVAKTLDKCALYSDAGRADFDFIEIVINPKNALNDSSDLSFYIKYSANYRSYGNASFVYRYTFYEVRSDGLFKSVYSDEITSSSASSEENHVQYRNVEILDISFKANKTSNYNDMVFDVKYTVSGEKRTIITPKLFMKYAFDSTERNWDIFREIANSDEGEAIICDEKTEIHQEVLTFKDGQYIGREDIFYTPTSLREYCTPTFSNVIGEQEVLNQLGITQEVRNEFRGFNVTAQEVKITESKNILLYIIYGQKEASEGAKRLDVIYVFVDRDNYKLLHKIEKEGILRLQRVNEAHDIERILINKNYENDGLMGEQTRFTNVLRQRFYFSGDKYTIYDNLIYITEDYEIIDLTEPYKGVFKSGEDELINF